MSVSKNKATNTWRYSVYLTGSNGQKIRKRKDGFSTKKEAEAAENKVIKEFEVYSLQADGSGDITLGQLFALYMEKLGATSHSTLINYQGYYSNWIEPFFLSDTKLKNINPAITLSFRDSLNKASISTSTKNFVLSFASSLFQYGVRLHYIKYNFIRDYCDKFKRPLDEREAIDEKHHQVWSKEQFNSFINSFETKKSFQYRVLFTLLYDTGMRINECLSLTWSKLDGNQLTIDRQAHIIHGEVQWSLLKTAGSKRTIYITDHDRDLLYQLKELKSKVVPQLDDYFIFGRALKPLTFVAALKTLKKHESNLDVPQITLHGFRHSHASLLFHNGVDVAYISKRLGHSNIQQTLKTYTHFVQQSEATQNDIIKSIFS